MSSPIFNDTDLSDPENHSKKLIKDWLTRHKWDSTDNLVNDKYEAFCKACFSVRDLEGFVMLRSPKFFELNYCERS